MTIDKTWFKNPSKNTFITVFLSVCIFWAIVWIILMFSFSSYGRPFRAPYKTCFGNAFKAIVKRQEGCRGKTKCSAGEQCFTKDFKKCPFMGSGCTCIKSDDCLNNPCQDNYDCLKNPLPCETEVNNCSFKDNECKPGDICTCIPSDDNPQSFNPLSRKFQYSEACYDYLKANDKKSVDVAPVCSKCCTNKEDDNLCIQEPLSNTPGEKCLIETCGKAHAFKTCCNKVQIVGKKGNEVSLRCIDAETDGNCVNYIDSDAINPEKEIFFPINGTLTDTSIKVEDEITKNTTNNTFDGITLECSDCKITYDSSDSWEGIDGTGFCLADPSNLDNSPLCCTSEEIELYNNCCVPEDS